MESWSKARADIATGPLAVWGRVTLINELFHLAVGHVLRNHQLTYNEFQVLAAIFVAGPPYEASPAQIARQNLLTSGGMTNLLNKMEASELIGRRPAEQDRRGVIVSMTKLGERQLVAGLSEENQLEHNLLDGLTEEEAAILAMLLRKLLLSLQSRAEKER